MVDLLHPVLDEVAPTLIGFLARNLVQVLDADPRGFETLPASLMAEVLGNPCLVIPCISHPHHHHRQTSNQRQESIKQLKWHAKIVRPTTWKDLNQEHAAPFLNLILQLCDGRMLSSLCQNKSEMLLQECRERDVFEAVAVWAYGLKDKADIESLAQSRADVEGLLLLIRFPLMTPTELQVILLAAPVCL